MTGHGILGPDPGDGRSPDGLRSALAAGEVDTPAGVDVSAIRARAHRQRRRRTALVTAAAAAVTALAVAVPVGLLRAEGAPPAAAPAPVAIGCPELGPGPPRNAGPGLAGALVPFAPQEGLICSYDASPGQSGGLTGVARMTAAELRSLLDRLDGPVQASPAYCTNDYGRPFAVQVGGAGRLVTLRLEPYGCRTVTNGVRTVSAADSKELLRDLGDRASSRSRCPAVLGRPLTVPPGGERRGTGVLPEEARRLLLCRYDPTGARQGDGKQTWNAVLDAEHTSRVVAGLNASPPLQPGGACTLDAGPLLLLFALTPDAVVPAVADAGGCGVVDNGVRQVTNKALVQVLVRLT